MLAKLYGGPAEGIEMEVDPSVETYTLYHRGQTYHYDRQEFMDNTTANPLGVKRTITYTLRKE